MANIKSQIKRNRQNEKRRVRNMSLRSRLNTLEKSALEAAGSDKQEDAMKAAIQGIDRAATKKVIHKNAAGRRKSRLVKRIREAASA